MSDTLLGRTVQALRSAGIPHALIGAGALALHGVSRSTFDIDLLAVDPAALAEQTWADLSAGGVVQVEIRHGDASDPLLGVVRLTNAGERDVDVIVGRQAWQGDTLTRATEIDLGGVPLAVVTAADLILLKLYAGGSQDLWDIEQLLASRPTADLAAEVERQMAVLPPAAHAVWARLRRGPQGS